MEHFSKWNASKKYRSIQRTIIITRLWHSCISTKRNDDTNAFDEPELHSSPFQSISSPDEGGPTDIELVEMDVCTKYRCSLYVNVKKHYEMHMS